MAGFGVGRLRRRLGRSRDVDAVMPCHHCGKARQSSAQAIKAVLKGDIHEGAVRARDAAAHIKAKLKGDVDGEQPASQPPSRAAGEGGSQGA